MLVEFLTVLIGVIVVLLLAEIIIKNTIELAKHYGVSGSFIGLTVLSIGTSIPEIMTHIIGSIDILNNPANFNKISALVLGTNIGSDIVQQNFILPIIGIIGTIIVIRKNLFAEMGGLIAAALLVWVFSLGGLISRLEGAFLLIAYAAYLIYLKKNNVGEKVKALNHLSKNKVALALILVLLSFGLMAFVADHVLDASIILVDFLPISASFFGIILLGVAAGLPELTTSLVAIFKGQKDVSAGILIGSNITNPLFGIGIGAVISSYAVPNAITYFDLPVKIATAFLLYYFLMKGKDLQKKEALVLIGLYLVYLVARIIFFPVDF